MAIFRKVVITPKNPPYEGIFYVLFDDFVDDAVLYGFFGGHPVVSVHVFFYLFDIFAGVFGENFGEATLEENTFSEHDFLVGDFAFGARRWLVNHNTGVF